ncbi:putative mitochondrial protein [Cucumis melo var. makuwa]|uniref:Putative mitochondrial protein n=1 Tax=Cucumis melo var. makuwa TaxID=1194695 RepID=A0A5D3BJZ6_CUCMM|nr:putative mitochondrial protein [Cucumis melo var. makuwa]
MKVFRFDGGGEFCNNYLQSFFESKGNAIDVFTTNASTPLARHKARLVAKGYHQVHGFDFDETVSPVVKKPTIQIILALAAQYSWSLTQLDVKNVFLHGILQETVYMSQPTAFQDKTCPNHVCLLHKSLYGLKQAPRAWFESFTSYLFTLGFVVSNADPSLFIRSVGSSLTYLLLYVDDIIVTGPDSSYISLLKTQLALEFQISDLGPLKYFLGLKIHSLPNGLFVNQVKYLNDLLHTSRMISAKSCTRPMSPSLDLYTTAPPFNDSSLYRKLVGSLQYLTFTRPDIAFSMILLTYALSLDSLPSLAQIQSPGLLESNLQSPVFPQKQNIVLSPLLLLIFTGYSNFSVISVFL